MKNPLLILARRWQRAAEELDKRAAAIIEHKQKHGLSVDAQTALSVRELTAKAAALRLCAEQAEAASPGEDAQPRYQQASGTG